MKPNHASSRSRLALGLGLLVSSQWLNVGLAADPLKSPAANEPKGDQGVAEVAAQKEVNLATVAKGATATGNSSSDLLAVLAGDPKAVAKIQPVGAAGTSVTTINLADGAPVNRIALNVGKQKGKLRLYVVNEDGSLGSEIGAGQSGKLLSEFALDGTQTVVNAEIGNISAKAIAIVWIPETPGQPLTISNVGIFSKSATSTPATAASTESGSAAKSTTTSPPATAASTETGSTAKSTTTSPPATTAGTETKISGSNAPTTPPPKAEAPSTTAMPIPPQTRPVSVY